MTGQMDLFAGNAEIPQQRQAPKPARGTTNDMDLIESVLRTAIDPGYVVIGAGESVHRYSTGQQHGEVERAPSYENDAVHQLVDRKLLAIGGGRRVKRGSEDIRANSVLVSNKARGMVSRWRNYKRPESWGDRRHA